MTPSEPSLMTSLMPSSEPSLVPSLMPCLIPSLESSLITSLTPSSMSFSQQHDSIILAHLYAIPIQG
eukprot:14172003-Ditylum_brightwellii.AAC.1